MSDLIERKQHEEHLESLEAFIASPAHAHYQTGKRAEAQALADWTLNLVARSLEDVLLKLDLEAQYRVALEAVNTFETARDQLKAKIAEMRNLEEESRQTKQV